MLKACSFLNRYFTEIKSFSLLLIILALIDNLASPVQHQHGLDFNILELLLRGWFFFAGFFGILGNGKTKRIRAFLVGTPYIYLGVFYITKHIETNIAATMIPAALSLFIGIWLLSLGVIDEFKQRICSRAGDVIYNIIDESNN